MHLSGHPSVHQVLLAAGTFSFVFSQVFAAAALANTLCWRNISLPLPSTSHPAARPFRVGVRQVMLPSLVAVYWLSSWNLIFSTRYASNFRVPASRITRM